MNSRGYHNEVIKCDWTPTINIIESKINPHKFHLNNVGIYEKVMTYEGPTHLVKTEPVVSRLIL